MEKPTDAYETLAAIYGGDPTMDDAHRVRAAVIRAGESPAYAEALIEATRREVMC